MLEEDLERVPCLCTMRYSVLRCAIFIERPGQSDERIDLPDGLDGLAYAIPLLDDAIENQVLSSLSSLIMLTGAVQTSKSAWSCLLSALTTLHKSLPYHVPLAVSNLNVDVVPGEVHYVTVVVSEEDSIAVRLVAHSPVLQLPRGDDVAILRVLNNEPVASIGSGIPTVEPSGDTGRAHGQNYDHQNNGQQRAASTDRKLRVISHLR